MRTFILPALSIMCLAACDQISEITTPEADPPPAEIVEAEPETVVDNPVQITPSGNIAEQKTAEIDWNAARIDFAERDFDEGAMAQVASGGAPAVPILLPDEPVGVASVGGAEALQFRPLADGYFAVKKGEVYDLIINGTDRLIARPDGVGTASDTELNYEETMTGATVSFSRYGASYLVEFMCKERETVLDGSCVNEAGALSEVEKLLIAGTR
ncbi:MAG: hypothetical protein AAFP81_13565 [Pseudomonadota bacterium]